jgi:arsenate reductase
MNERPLDPFVDKGLQEAVEALYREFTGVFSRETIAKVVSESHDALGPYRLLTYIPLLAHRAARERLRDSAGVHGRFLTGRPEVLVISVHDAGRAQLAAALLAHRAHGRLSVRSASSQPADRIEPAVTAVITELGAATPEETAEPLTEELVQAADVLITLGRGNACPVLPDKRYVDWDVESPTGKDAVTIRRIRDEIDAHVQQLLAKLLPVRSLPDPMPPAHSRHQRCRRVARVGEPRKH